MRIPSKAVGAVALSWSCLAAAQAGEEITAGGPQGDLHGTFVAPASGGPMVLIIPGSGPTDRNGNNPAGIRADAYRLLAESLSATGIGSVRIDKRGLFGSAAAVSDPNAVTIADYVTDVGSWVAAIRGRTGAECVWLAGHSEGGLIALAAAGKVEGLCGLILLATAGRPLGAVIREQLEANPANAPLLADAFAALDRLEAGQRVEVANLHPALQQLFAPPVQGFLIDMLALRPAALAAETDLPMLILQGGKDIQVSIADAEALHAARPDAVYVALPEVNHVLKAVEGDDRAANLAAYGDPGRPLAPGVAEAIASFLLSRGA